MLNIHTIPFLLLLRHFRSQVLQIRDGKQAVQMLLAAIGSGNEILLDCVVHDLGLVRT